MSSPELTELERLRLTPGHIERVVVLTGAGISAESGIPTFRAVDGYWSRYRPEDLATPEAFAQNPQVVWEWYLARRHTIAQADPNAGHYALVEMDKLLSGQFTLITQNVDGLHQRAGSHDLFELHGNIFINRCSLCSRRFSDEVLNFQELPPVCPSCRGAIRPDVVWFGENLNISTVEDAFTRAREATLFLSIGTSSVVHPAATLPIVAAENGAFLIEVNPELTPISEGADLSLRAPASRVLPRITEMIRTILTSTASKKLS
jgi:NAD-dependent deacetylase